MQKSNLLISFTNIKGGNLTVHKQNYLRENDLIIYTIYLPNYIEIINDLINYLIPEERNRAKRFHNEKDRNRFVICRSLLKFALAIETNLDAKNISLDYNPNKKPYLASQPWLHFNVSHSEDFAVIALSRNQVGIDIEHISNNFNFTNLLQDIFTEKEIQNIQNSDDRKYAFYTSWTRKEAFAKALSKGIDDDFKHIPCLDGQHNINPTLLKNTKNWQIHSFDLANHYLGAVAFENLSTISKNLIMYNMPNTMKDLLEITQIRNENL